MTFFLTYAADVTYNLSHSIHSPPNLESSIVQDLLEIGEHLPQAHMGGKHAVQQGIKGGGTPVTSRNVLRSRVLTF